ncbi:MAG: hypothetical protein JNM17_32410 [Archangium sp.]|nr:hypothetical protein [Archangium sp.]
MRAVVFGFAVLALCACPDQKKNANGDPKSVIARVQKEKNAARLPVLGERRLEGDAQDLRAAADGELLTVLLDGVKPTGQGIPPPMRIGSLWAVPSKGGKAVKLGNGVTNMPGGWLHTPDSKWVLFTAAWDPSQQVGELYVQDAKNLEAERMRLSVKASYFVPSDDGTQVAFVEAGVLKAGKLPNGPFPQLAGEVSTAEFSNDGRYLYFKRRYSAAGGLYQVDLQAERPEPRRLIDQVTEYTVLRSGKYVVVSARATPADRTFQLHLFEVNGLKGRKLSDDAHRYRISRDGKYLAWRDNDPGPEKGTLQLMELPDGKPRTLGKAVNDFDFSNDGARFVYRDNFTELGLGGRDAQKEGSKLVERVGDLMVVEMPSGEPKLLARQSPNWLFNPSTATLAFTARIDRPEVTRRLYLYPVGATAPVALKDWLYEYQFPGKGELLYFRSDCLREGRACDLNSVSATPDMSAADAGVSAKKEVESTFGFRFSGDGKRAVLAFAHLTDQTFDIAHKNFETGAQRMIDQYVEWPAIMLADGSVAYLVTEKSRPGVYVAPAAVVQAAAPAPPPAP